jgi:hypothetical protein
VTQLFDLNVRIQQLTWSSIFYEKYSTSLSTIVLVVLTTANFGGFSNFCRYNTRSQAGKSTGYRPTLKPLNIMEITFITEGNWSYDWPATKHIMLYQVHFSVSGSWILWMFMTKWYQIYQRRLCGNDLMVVEITPTSRLVSLTIIYDKAYLMVNFQFGFQIFWLCTGQVGFVTEICHEHKIRCLHFLFQFA